MSRRYDCSDPMERSRGIAEAFSAVRRGELIVLPTDTVYGVGVDAFIGPSVTALLEAKGRGWEMPPPVLVGSVRAATALVEDLGTYGQDLIDEFWPGALTLVCRANPNLMWDLGETKGTVAVRMPMHELAVELLKETGPMAVSSANLSGQPAARTAEEAEKMLGDAVSVYLDGGVSGHAGASTIVDLTGSVPRLLRVGAIPEEKIRSVVGVLLTDEDEPEPEQPDEMDEADESDGPAEAPSGVDTAKPSLTKGVPSQAQDEPAEAPAKTAEPAEDPAETVADAVTEAPPEPATEAPAETVTEAPADPVADAAVKPSLTKDSPLTEDDGK